MFLLNWSNEEALTLDDYWGENIMHLKSFLKTFYSFYQRGHRTEIRNNEYRVQRFKTRKSYGG